ncbi:type IV pilus biogenesis/stability protein PilW [Pelagibaculum spongiae]|uniref:Type IV pilus biogenesis/stability protein PilW n=1 Tax=Pelagibaculum spongiae TaxID=2080658 RepID=A0A2V1H6F1_9GAMM|nr:type IV pilus biogenesis/stability protein PilW [Pelagibaculum spongiae]PVZ72335.1 type IV pilus biogenesis/stability protein PilW [Pelagibaculum spongiae]
MKGRFGWILLLGSLVLAGCQSSLVGKDPRDNLKGEQRTSSAESHLRLGYAYLQSGQIERGKDRFLRALQYAPELPKVQAGMGYYFSQVGQNQLAEVHYTEALRLDPTSSETLNSFGVHLCNTGKYSQAQVNFRKALSNQFYGTPARAYVNSGLCLLKENKPKQAIDDLREALKTEPENQQALRALTEFYLEDQKLNLATHYLNRYSRTAKSSPPLLWLQYQLATAKGDDKLATRALNTLQNSYPESDETFQLLQSLDRSNK